MGPSGPRSGGEATIRGAGTLASSLLITEVDFQLASSRAAGEAIAGGDGAKHVFALVFGWAPALVLVCLSWCARRAWMTIRHR